jgi:4-amino-4-deoxy-L-arabinose transferase-like glycosyltransferase
MVALERAAAVKTAVRRWWPEIALAVLACAIFLGFLGSLELWGKREQRAAVEALDTIDHNHWLLAQIQGRPRLEKPPLPRWTIAALMGLTGRRDEWVVRLPSACSGLAIVALVYALGISMGGRPVALASAMALCTTGLFIAELRQAGNDGPLALFTTLALYAAWRRLHGLPPSQGTSSPFSGIDPPGSRGWAFLFHAALGLGFLCKGPIILLLVGFTVTPYLTTIGGLASGLRRLSDVWGLIIFLLLALCWPVPVLLADSNALGVWLMEIGQKTGLLPIAHRERAIFVLEWPGMSLPWVIVGLAGVSMPFVRAGRAGLPWRASTVWFPWWWAIGNLAMLSCWAVAKPNYYVPCLPGMALLVGMAWIRLSRAARDRGQTIQAVRARLTLYAQWALLLLLGVFAQLTARSLLSASEGSWSVAMTVAMAGLVGLGVRAWRRGADALALVPVVAACGVGVLIGYGFLAPADNHSRGHRELAQRLEHDVPLDVPSIMFFHEIDEGLWFYLRKHQLVTVPGSQPHYSASYDTFGCHINLSNPFGTLQDPIFKDREEAKQALLAWLNRDDLPTPYLLIRDTLYRCLAADLASRVTPIYQEVGLKRNGLILLRIERQRSTITAVPTIGGPARR